MALVLGAVLLAASAAVPPALPAPRDLARSVLETHGQELRLLKLLGVTRTIFDWGTHFSINFTARQPACPKNLPDRRGAGCQARPGRVQRCTAQVSVFTFLPDVPLSMVECGQEPPVLIQRGRFGRFLSRIRRIRPRINFDIRARGSIRLG
ncbi:PREDICTED: cathelicidin-2-like [Haliaeetus leucocephalus]|uniref:cathelicidin-2-like n=1 Tax=Haliaeetus leucocephalus TaxID=52644 RepID=UPI00053CE359|nr:PREDICTED: cathelicidin-2-like [Haliaeetus leucocephalus]